MEQARALDTANVPKVHGDCPRCVNLGFVQETLQIATERYQKAEALNAQYKKAILALIDCFEKD